MTEEVSVVPRARIYRIMTERGDTSDETKRTPWVAFFAPKCQPDVICSRQHLHTYWLTLRLCCRCLMTRGPDSATQHRSHINYFWEKKRILAQNTHTHILGTFSHRTHFTYTIVGWTALWFCFHQIDCKNITFSWTNLRCFGYTTQRFSLHWTRALKHRSMSSSLHLTITLHCATIHINFLHFICYLHYTVFTQKVIIDKTFYAQLKLTW